MSREQPLPFHHWLLADSNRTGAYRNALSQVVRENDVVVDIGTGSGILAFFACMAGARKVYAIEVTNALRLARELCHSNGFDNRIEFHQGRSFDIQLPERSDVIVSDTGCSFGLQGGMLNTLLDAKERFLKPGGRIVPHSLQLLVAPVEMKDQRNLEIWKKDRYGLDLSSIRRYAANTDYPLRVGPTELLAPPAVLTTIHFQDVNNPYVVGETLSVLSRDGAMHGLAAWIVLELAPGISFTNSPLAPTVDWTHSFFPIETPVELHAGDRVRAKIQTNNGEIWRWRIEVTGPGEDSAVEARFDQSTMRSFPISAEEVRQQLPDYKPTPSRKSEAEKYLLAAFDGKRTAAQLADELFECFADCFPNRTSAFHFVTQVIARCV